MRKKTLKITFQIYISMITKTNKIRTRSVQIKFTYFGRNFKKLIHYFKANINFLHNYSLNLNIHRTKKQINTKIVKLPVRNFTVHYWLYAVNYHYFQICAFLI